MDLMKWAIKWCIPYGALHDLQCQMGMVNTDPETANTDGKSETAVQNDLRLEASQTGNRLWRNNVGAVETEDGSFIRYGLCNDSKQLNSRIKSSDLIGIKPVLITQDMVGRTIGQFLAREVKPENWQYSGTKREVAQLAFIELILSLSGDAAFATGRGTL